MISSQCTIATASCNNAARRPSPAPPQHMAADAPTATVPPPAAQSLKLYQVVIFATPVLFALILILLFIMFYLRRRRIRRLNARVRTQFLAGALFSPPAYAEQGLSKSFRQRLPIFPYDENHAVSKEFLQCAVCLDDYEVGEKLQQLPGCSHAFHATCIDEWLASNATCPICRTCVLQLPDSKFCVSEFSTPASDGRSPAGGDSGSRRWEERVLSQATLHDFYALSSLNNQQLGGGSRGGDISNAGSGGGSSNGITLALSDSGGLSRVLSIDHSMVNIERI